MNSYSIVVLSNPVWPVIGRTGLLLDTKKPINNTYYGLSMGIIVCRKGTNYLLIYKTFPPFL